MAKRTREEPAPEPTKDAQVEPQCLPLPTEIFHMICSELGTHGVASFRLACKAFCVIGKEHLVEELCFFLHRRSIMKVVAIANHPYWARHVKTLVFENVEPKDWSKMRKESDLINERVDKKAYSRYDSFLWQNLNNSGYFEDRPGSLHSQIIPILGKFTNLKAITCHHGFKDPRPSGPDVNTPLKILFDRYTAKQLELPFWKVRGSGRIWAPARLPDNWNFLRGANRTLAQFHRIAQAAFGTRSLAHLDTVNIQSHHSAVLHWQRPEPGDYLLDNDGLKHLTIQYHPHHFNGAIWQVAPGSLCRDLEYLSKPEQRLVFEPSQGDHVLAGGTSNLRSLTLASRLDNPSKWLAADLFSNGGSVYLPRWPHLEEVRFVNCVFKNEDTVDWLVQQRIRVTMKNVFLSEENAIKLFDASSLKSLEVSGLVIIRGNKQDRLWIVADEHNAPAFARRFRPYVVPMDKSISWFVHPDNLEQCRLQGKEAKTVLTEDNAWAVASIEHST